MAEFGEAAVSKASLLLQCCCLEESTADRAPDGALAATGAAQALFSPRPVGERGISLMQKEESCPSLFPGMHFPLNNEVTNVEYLLHVLWWWFRGAAAA